MKVIIWCREWDFWYVLEEQGALYLWVNSEQRFVTLSILLRLNSGQAAMVGEGGTTYVENLAMDVHNHFRTWWPGRVTGALETAAGEAVSKWYAGGGREGSGGT